jgi:hypothetical protein
MQLLIVRVVLTWFLFIPIAIINGAVREKFYKSYVGDLPAHQISTVIASVAFITLSYFMLRSVISNVDIRDLFMIGLFWVLLTMVFEFGFGHYVDRVSWARLFADFNFFKGRVWGLFLLIIFLSPYIVKILKTVNR